MKVIELTEAQCRTEQARIVLLMWLDGIGGIDDEQAKKIGAVLTLLDGVTLSMERAESELLNLQFPEHRRTANA